jgi:hypothetical protein
MGLSEVYHRGMTMGEVTAWPDDRTSWSLAGDHAVPTRFVAKVMVGEFWVTALILTTQQGPQVASMAVEHPMLGMGAPITQAVLRTIAIDKLIREAVAKVRRPAQVVDRQRGKFTIPGEEGIFGGLRVKEGRGSRTEHDQLVEVAEIYKRARNESRPPVKAVAEEMRFSRSHAGRLVGQAREVGLLPAATPGKASVLEAELIKLLERDSG